MARKLDVNVCLLWVQRECRWISERTPPPCVFLENYTWVSSCPRRDLGHSFIHVINVYFTPAINFVLGEIQSSVVSSLRVLWDIPGHVRALPQANTVSVWAGWVEEGSWRVQSHTIRQPLLHSRQLLQESHVGLVFFPPREARSSSVGMKIWFFNNN